MKANSTIVVDTTRPDWTIMVRGCTQQPLTFNPSKASAELAKTAALAGFYTKITRAGAKAAGATAAEKYAAIKTTVEALNSGVWNGGRQAVAAKPTLDLERWVPVAFAALWPKRNYEAVLAHNMQTLGLTRTKAVERVASVKEVMSKINELVSAEAGVSADDIFAGM